MAEVVAEKPVREERYARCVRETLKGAGKENFVWSPPMDITLDLGVVVKDQALEARLETARFRALAKLLAKILGSLRTVASNRALVNICGQPIAVIYQDLARAKTLTDQYSGTNWVNKKFMSRTGFDEKWLEVFHSLAKSSAKLEAAVKVVKEAQSIDKELAAAKMAMDEWDEEEFFDCQEFTEAAEAKAADDAVAEEKRDARQSMINREKAARPDREHDGKHGSVLPWAWEGNFHMAAKKADEVGGLDEMGGTYGLLHQAVFWQDLEGVAMLTNRGADVNMQTRQRCLTLGVQELSTPLHLAAIIGNDRIVRQLIVDGADVQAKDADDNTPFDVACTSSCKESLLKAAELRCQQTMHAELAAAGKWQEAMEIIHRGRLPANAKHPGDGYSIHQAARAGDIAAYANLVYSGALPLQRTTCAGRMLPSDACDETSEGKAIKAFILSVENKCLAVNKVVTLTAERTLLEQEILALQRRVQAINAELRAA